MPATPRPLGGTAPAPAATPNAVDAPGKRSLGTVGKIYTVIGIVALTTLGVGAVGLASVRGNADLSEQMYSRDLTGSTEVGSLKYGYTLLRVKAANTALVAPEGRAEAAKERDEVGAQLAKDALAFQARTDLTDAERTLAKTVAENIKAYADGISAVDALYAAKKSSEADELSANTLGPASAKVREGLDQIISLKTAQAAQSRDDIRAAAKVASLAILVAAVVGILVTLLAGRRVGSGIVRGLNAIEYVAEGAANGDLTRRANVGTGDETGRAARALDRAVEQLGGIVGQVRGTAERVADSVAGLHTSTRQVVADSQRVTSSATEISTSADSVSTNVQTVSAGTEEMTASIREIAKNAQDAAGVAAGAVQVADQTNATVAQLGQSSAEIGEVVKTITSIAEQTNLLALNATIEAARAGEAGKGFAVVANEVKDLAQETAKATEDISHKVEQIQSDTQAAVAAISEIGAIIAQINDTQSTIASAVEEQTATTNEMGRNVSEAASGSTAIAGSVRDIAADSQAATATIESMNVALTELADMSRDLQERVHAFTV